MGNPDDEHYCIVEELARTRSDVEGNGLTDGLTPEDFLCFAGSQLETMRGDSLNADGHVPDLEEAMEFTFTHDAPKGA